jgi:hypothetical protein
LSVDANFENTEDDDWKFDIVYKSILRCRIPVFTDKIKLNLQKHLFNEYQYPSSIKSGKFIDVFNELYEVTEDLRDLKIVDLEKFINSRKKTAGGNVEIYFTKFPVGSINLFGSVIILIIQFYLWINLRHLRIIKIRIAHQQKEDIQLHWIALLSDNYAIGFTLITFIAPCVVTFFLNLFFGFLSTFLSSLIIVWWMKINGLKIIKII